jgi:hypothetical protein
MNHMPAEPTGPICPYCRRPAVYQPEPGAHTTKRFDAIWICVPCDAWVGCRSGTLGPLAGQLGIAPRDCRVTLLSGGQLVRAQELCHQELSRPR